jgi:hypothetical protein
MYLESNVDPGDRWVLALASLVVCTAWVWVAVRTRSALDIISRRVIPYSARTIWLVKIVAIIIGAGSVVGLLSRIGLPWPVALMPAAAVVAVALSDKVEAVVPPTPPQDAENYRSSWQECMRLRRSAMRAGIMTGAAFVVTISLFVISGTYFREPVQSVVFVLCALLMLLSMFIWNYEIWKWTRWPCPRCGCSYRGYWGKPWLPKRCAYCGLPRWSENPDDTPRA